jgi:HlyD family secretion protein/macrolide-specific efflux system membrane fusion protein
MRRAFVILNIALAVTLAGVVAVAVLAVGDPTSAAATTTTPTVKVSRGQLTATVSASGNLSARTSIGANFTGSGGTVTGILVKVGDVVTAGQELAKVDDTSAKLSLTSANASLEQAQAGLSTTTQKQTSQQKSLSASQIKQAQISLQNAELSVTQARATYARDEATQDQLVKQAQQAYDAATDATRASLENALNQAEATRASTLLRDSQSIQTSQAQVTSAQAALTTQKASVAVNSQPASSGSVASSRAQVAAAEVQVAQAQLTLDQTVLKAPVSGTVVSISGEVGASSTAATSSSSSSSSSTSTAFMTIASMDQLQVTTMVAEADAAKVQLGQKATVSFPALGTSASGSVTAIDLTQTVTNNVVEYGVTVLLDSAPTGVRLGQTSSVSITTATRDSGLSVPSSAITKSGPVSTVTVRKNGQDVVTVVGTGLVGDSGTEITSGLTEGDQVVISSSTGTGGTFTFPGGGLGGGLGQ